AEEVSRAQVRVAVGDPGVDRLRLDGAVGARVSECVPDLERALELAELAAHRGYAHVLDGEADLGVGRVDRPGPAGDQRLGGGWRAHACLLLRSSLAKY